MKRYFLQFSYNGSQYRGVQRNILMGCSNLLRDVDTIQGALECAFRTLIPECINEIKLRTSSRTDAGVHGLCNTAHIDLSNKYNSFYNPDIVLQVINRYFTKCNHHIRLLDFIPVKDTFHARYFAKSRTYLYRLMIAKDGKNQKIPMLEKSQSLLIKPGTFDIEKVQKATRLFMGKKDFTTFSAKLISHKPVVYVRSLNSLTVEKGEPLMSYDPLSQNFEYWNIVCNSRSFLYNQVRRIVAALVSVGTGKLTERDINILLQVPSHYNWPSRIQLVPAHALYLVSVNYDQEELDKHTIKLKLQSPGSTIVVPVDENDV